MSNYIRRRKSKAMQDPAGINNGYNFGGSGGSYIMKRRANENSVHNNIRKTHLYSLSSTNTGASAQTCCAIGERKVAPVVHYSYKTYMDMKLKGCSICPISDYTKEKRNAQKEFDAAKKVIDDAEINGRTPTTQEVATYNAAQKKLKEKIELEEKHLAAVASMKNVYKRMPDNSTEFYLENKKSKVFLETDDITACPNLTKKDTECIESGESCKPTLLIDARRSGQDQEKEVLDRRKAIKDSENKILAAQKVINDKIAADATYTATAAELKAVTDAKTELNNNLKRNITLGRLKQKSYRQYMNSKKVTITKPRMFNYASLKIFATKSKRVCGNKPFESPLANIQSCKHI